MVDTQDLKSCGQKWLCGFKSRPGYPARSESLVSQGFLHFRTWPLRVLIVPSFNPSFHDTRPQLIASALIDILPFRDCLLRSRNYINVSGYSIKIRVAIHKSYALNQSTKKTNIMKTNKESLMNSECTCIICLCGADCACNGRA